MNTIKLEGKESSIQYEEKVKEMLIEATLLHAHSFGCCTNTSHKHSLPEAFGVYFEVHCCANPKCDAFLVLHLSDGIFATKGEPQGITISPSLSYRCGLRPSPLLSDEMNLHSEHKTLQ